MIFEIVSALENVETIAEGNSVRVRHLLAKKYGKGRWKKKKGFATVKLTDGSFRLAEVHGTKHTGSASVISRSSSLSLIRL